jgi:hypothetical protein
MKLIRVLRSIRFSTPMKWSMIDNDFMGRDGVFDFLSARLHYISRLRSEIVSLTYTLSVPVSPEE